MTMTISGAGTIGGLVAGGLPDASITQPDLAAGVGGNGPAFRAHNNTNQSMSASAWTKVQFQVEDFDTASCFDNATNYRFTPNVAGYYQVAGSVSFNFLGGSGTLSATAIYKNGSIYGQNRSELNGSYGPFGPIEATDLVYLNGTTDYVELYCYTNNATPYISGSADGTRFSAFLARAA